MIAVVIPSYKVTQHILEVIAGIGKEVQRIYIVDDCCPDSSGRFVEEHCNDPRVLVLYHSQNKGVGGATMTGYRKALEEGMEIVVKIDGDGQMDSSYIPEMIEMIQSGQADYVKGNRFSDLRSLRQMPRVRVFGNSVLSVVNKFVNGYWNIMDPTNGYTAIHRTALSMLELDKISTRYFFESDMLFRLGTIRAVVADLNMPAIYGTEKSGLKISRVIFSFPPKYIDRYYKRVFNAYFIREFNVATIQLLLGLLLFFGGLAFGAYHWLMSVHLQTPATSGTVMLAALPAIIGFQLLLSALQYDIRNVPSIPLSRLFGQPKNKNPRS